MIYLKKKTQLLNRYFRSPNHPTSSLLVPSTVPISISLLVFCPLPTLHPSRRCSSLATAPSNSGGSVASLEISPSKVRLQPMASHPSPFSPLSFQSTITKIKRSECANLWISKCFLSFIITLVKLVQLEESIAFFSFLLCCLSFLSLIVILNVYLIQKVSWYYLNKFINFLSLLMIMIMNKCVQEEKWDVAGFNRSCSRNYNG